MERFRIEGGAALSGTVRVDGAKNAALPACIASLLTDEPVVLHRVPQLRDVSTILYTLGALGRRVIRHGDHVSITGGDRMTSEADPYSVRQMRASFLVLAPLVARQGRAVVPLPGGCAIGRRPVDLHLDGLRALGATVTERDGVVAVTADRLKGARCALPYPSVGATEQLLMAATLASGETTIAGAAIEPEVDDLIALLKAMGADIERRDRTITVGGRPRLHGAEHTLIPDRMEAGTFLLAAAITRGEVEVREVRSEDLTAFLDALASSGAEVTDQGTRIRVRGAGPPRPVRLETSPHPGFPTDLHPPFVAYLATGEGASRLVESVFEDRFAYVPALVAMGARIVRDGTAVDIRGVAALGGRVVEASDIRAGAALVLAGLAARGTTVIGQLDHIDRGYARLDRKLRGMGATIDRQEA